MLSFLRSFLTCGVYTVTSLIGGYGILLAVDVAQSVYEAADERLYEYDWFPTADSGSNRE